MPPAPRRARRSDRRAPAPAADAPPTGWSDRRARSRRARHRPAVRPRPGRHSRQAGSRAAPVPGNRPSRRRAASRRCSPQKGNAASATRPSARAAETRLARVERSTRNRRASIRVRGKNPRGRTTSASRKAIWPARICQAGDSRAERLGDAENHAAQERAPKAAEPADDHRLEREDQPSRTAARIKVVRIASSTPAIAVTIAAMRHGDAQKGAGCRPHRARAVSASSEAARKARPSAVR